MPNRTICLINDSFPPVTDGVANAVVNYARVITESGSTAVVATPAYPGADDSALGFPVVRYPSIDMTKLVGYHAGFPFSEKTMKTLMEYPFDLIHCHCPITSAVLARELRSRIHVPTVFTYHTKFDIDIANAIHAKLLQEGAKSFSSTISAPSTRSGRSAAARERICAASATRVTGASCRTASTLPAAACRTRWCRRPAEASTCRRACRSSSLSAA